MIKEFHTNDIRVRFDLAGLVSLGAALILMVSNSRMIIDASSLQHTRSPCQ